MMKVNKLILTLLFVIISVIGYSQNFNLTVPYKIKQGESLENIMVQSNIDSARYNLRISRDSTTLIKMDSLHVNEKYTVYIPSDWDIGKYNIMVDFLFMSNGNTIKRRCIKTFFIR